MILYSAKFRGHEISSEDNSLLLGIWTTITAAIETAREARMHTDDEWFIVQHHVNVIDNGQTVWDSQVDDNRKHAGRYARFFPAGFPEKRI